MNGINSCIYFKSINYYFLNFKVIINVEIRPTVLIRIWTANKHLGQVWDEIFYSNSLKFHSNNKLRNTAEALDINLT